MCAMPHTLPGSREPPPGPFVGPPERIAGMGAALALCLLPIRAWTLSLGASGAGEAPLTALYSLAASCSDILYAVLLTGAGLLGAHLLRKSPSALRVFTGAFAGLALLSLLAGLGNIVAVRMLGGPVTARWLYYGEFLRTLDALQGLFAHLTAWNLALCAGFSALLFLLARVLRKLLFRLLRRLRPGALLALVLPLLALYLVGSQRVLAIRDPAPRKIVNPITALVRSLLVSADAPALFTMKVSCPPPEILRVRERGPNPGHGFQSGHGVRNVLFFVMESVSFEALETYGTGDSLMPSLARYRDRATTFRSVYAQGPATDMGMLSLLCATYPWLSHRTLTKEHPDIPLPSLSGELKRHGYRTGFFSSADLTFSGMGDFLSHRGFDLLEDVRTRRGPFTRMRSERWYFLDGSDDIATARSLVAWLPESPGETPFFAVLWTHATHYPYWHTGPSRDFGVKDEALNRYLNAIRHGDEALGILLGALEERHLLETTLVVVMGDHGEAFGRHGHYGHGTALYEENLRVPCVFINPRLFGGESRETLGGLLDIPPTVLDILGLEVPGDWQGHSLFSPDRPGRLYFCAPWSDFLVGYRDRDEKVIYNADANRYELFDIRSDPLESRNLAELRPERLREARERLAAWVQYQRRLYEGLLGPARERTRAAGNGGQRTPSNGAL